MKRAYFVFVLAFVVGAVLSGCGTGNESADSLRPDTHASQSEITKEMAYEGIDNYCRNMYDWGIAESAPDIMYVEAGEETDREYQVIFRSYTGAFVYFYVDKLSGITRLIEYVPALELEEEIGTIDLYDYLE